MIHLVKLNSAILNRYCYNEILKYIDGNCSFSLLVLIFSKQTAR